MGDIKIIENGTPTDATEVMSNLNAISNYIAVNKINSLKVGLPVSPIHESLDNSQTYDFNAAADFEAATYNTSTLFANSGYAWYDGTFDVIYAGSLYDSYSDATIDTTMWTATGTGAGGTTSEVANSYIEAYGFQSGGGGTATIDANGSSTQCNLLPVGTTSEIIFYCNLAVDSDSASPAADGYIALRDDLGNSVTLKDVIAADGDSFTGTIRLVIDASNCRVYTDRDTFVDVDITSLVGTSYWYLRLYATIVYGNGSNWARVRFYPLVYVNQGNISASTIETARTISTGSITATKAFLHYDESYGDGIGTSTFGVSADDGAGFTTVTLDNWTNISSTGSSISSKYTLQGTSREKLVKIDSQCLLYSA